MHGHFVLTTFSSIFVIIVSSHYIRYTMKTKFFVTSCFYFKGTGSFQISKIYFMFWTILCCIPYWLLHFLCIWDFTKRLPSFQVYLNELIFVSLQFFLTVHHHLSSLCPACMTMHLLSRLVLCCIYSYQHIHDINSSFCPIIKVMIESVMNDSNRFTDVSGFLDLFV